MSEPEAPLSVLLVDDNGEGLRNRALLFMGSGMEVHTATTLEEALAQVHARGFDVVVVDINLRNEPLDRSGVELAKAVRTTRPDVPLVAYSGFYGEDEVGPELGELFDAWAVKGSSGLQGLNAFVARCRTLAEEHRGTQ